jgi:hypothetical protein
MEVADGGAVMKRCALYAKISIMLVGMVSLSACSTETAGTPQSEGTKPAVFATATPTTLAKASATAIATGIPQKQTPVIDASPTTIPAQASTNAGAEEIAPSYEEIRATILALMGDPELTTTPEERKQIAVYQESLKGKRIEGWVGWTGTISPPKELAGADQHNFTMWVSMDDPNIENEHRYTEVLLSGLSREQAEQFEAWSMNPDSKKINKVIFSGTIDSVIGTVTVTASVTQVMPAK